MAHSWLWDWQTLVAGIVGSLIALAAGALAYVGSLRAANRQVVAIRAQIEEERAARKQADERRRTVIEWAVKAEALRLEAAIRTRKDDALPSGQQPASRRIEQLVIASSPLLRGEREDISLLDNPTRMCLEAVAYALADYNARIETANDPTSGSPLIVPETLKSFGDLVLQVRNLFNMTHE